MIRYEVRLACDPTRAEAVEAYMIGRHIPDVLATGCFAGGAHFDRDESGAFRTTYLAASREEFERYVATHAERLRAEFLAHFPDGVVPTRELWNELAAWEVP